MLCAEHVSLAIGPTRLLDDVSVEVVPSRLVVVVGPNGAGKSTLLALLSGERQPSSGAVRLDGRDIGQWDRRARARRVATMHQRSSLDASFTVREVVALGRLPHELDGTDAARCIDDALDLVAIVPLADRTYCTLSGGERQLVHLARATAQLLPIDASTPPVLLLDEPTASLDVAHAQRVLSIARTLCVAGLAALIVMHDLTLAAAYADEMLVLARGRSVARGAPDDIWRAPLVRDVWGVDVVRVEHPRLSRPVLIPVAEEKR